jgi:hypothetical protein
MKCTTSQCFWRLIFLKFGILGLVDTGKQKNLCFYFPEQSLRASTRARRAAVAAAAQPTISLIESDRNDGANMRAILTQVRSEVTKAVLESSFSSDREV